MKSTLFLAVGLLLVIGLLFARERLRLAFKVGAITSASAAACAAAADGFFPFDGLLTQPLGVTVYLTDSRWRRAPRLH